MRRSYSHTLDLSYRHLPVLEQTPSDLLVPTDLDASSLLKQEHVSGAKSLTYTPALPALAGMSFVHKRHAETRLLAPHWHGGGAACGEGVIGGEKEEEKDYSLMTKRVVYKRGGNIYMYDKNDNLIAYFEGFATESYGIRLNSVERKDSFPVIITELPPLEAVGITIAIEAEFMGGITTGVDIVLFLQGKNAFIPHVYTFVGGKIGFGSGFAISVFGAIHRPSRNKGDNNLPSDDDFDQYFSISSWEGISNSWSAQIGPLGGCSSWTNKKGEYELIRNEESMVWDIASFSSSNAIALIEIHTFIRSIDVFAKSQKFLEGKFSISWAGSRYTYLSSIGKSENNASSSFYQYLNIADIFEFVNRDQIFIDLYKSMFRKTTQRPIEVK